MRRYSNSIFRWVLGIILMMGPTAGLSLAQDLPSQDTSSAPAPMPSAAHSPMVGPATMTEGQQDQLTTPRGNVGTVMDLRLSRQLRPYTFRFDLDTPEEAAHPLTGQQLNGDVIALDRKVKIPSIHEVITDLRYFKGQGNKALEGEVDYLNWGANTTEALNFRRGNYYTITVDNHSHKRPLTVVFQYRQLLTQESIRTLKQDLPAFTGAKRAYFGVIGAAYWDYGPVGSWRVTVRDGDTIIAQETSAIW